MPLGIFAFIALDGVFSRSEPWENLVFGSEQTDFFHYIYGILPW
jgi:hypothetical protein